MIKILLAQVFVIPAAVLCYLPVRNKLRCSRRKTILIVASILSASYITSALVRFYFDPHENLIITIFLPLLFVAYHFTLRVQWFKSLGVFMSVISLFMIITNIVYASTNVLSGFAKSVIEYQIVMGFVCIPISVVLIPMFAKNGSFIVEKMDYRSVWLTRLVFSSTIFLYSILLKPSVKAHEKAEVIDISVFISQIVLLVLWVLMNLLFYYSVKVILEQKRIEVDNQLLNMRKNEFETQQKYIKDSERSRHDFRQSVRTMLELYDSGDMEALGRYLHEYEKSLPNSEVINYTENAPMNALLYFFTHICVKNKIRFKTRVRLPASLSVDDVDLCIITGNILENAVAACKLLEDDRFIELAIVTESDAQLFIVVTNSFNGDTVLSGKHYRSTKHPGQALGLSSVESTVETYKGIAKFSHEGN